MHTYIAIITYMHHHHMSLPPPYQLIMSLLLFFLLLFHGGTFALNDDGVLLLSFKYAVLDDPYFALAGWSYADDTPCAWNGVACAGTANGSRVVSLILPGAGIVGEIPTELAEIEHLRHLDLSGNSLNGSLPPALLSAPGLRVLSLANNDLSGRLPDVCNASVLQNIDLSGNGLVGNIPTCVSLLPNLTFVDLGSNNLAGPLPAGFRRVEHLDLRSNHINGSLPDGGFGGSRLRFLNLSGNELSGEIPVGFAAGIPASATVDLSYNNLTGGVPGGALASQNPQAFSGNKGLCGRPIGNLCPAPSTLSDAPNGTGTSPPAFAAIPKTGERISTSGGLHPAVIAGIVAGNLLAAAIVLLLLFLCIRRRRTRGKKEEVLGGKGGVVSRWLCAKRREEEGSETEESEEAGARPETEVEKKGVLVTVDGEREMELETLLKASAYILGASGASIVYKAVLGDGTVLAVRRIGDGGGSEKVKDFEAQVRGVAKLRHPNLVGVRGFYWGSEEKLLICEYVPNGSLAGLSYKKTGGSSPYHLPWDARLRVARGVARGLAYLHEKKAVHGNLKPSNILFGQDMEPKISDFGLDRLLCGSGAAGGSSSRLPIGSFRNFGSKRSTFSNGSAHEPSPTAASPFCAASSTPYLAPELYKNIKPSAKWDVYSFGVLLLELITGRAPSEAEIGEWSEGLSAMEEGRRAVRMVDGAVRGELEGKEEVVASCLRLALSCAAAAPQRRPTMKEVVQILDKIS